MKITKDFPGGNILVLSVEDNDVFVEREIRNDNGYFYWAFCVTGAQGKTLRFRFPGHTRVGPFGAAVSHDLKKWSWGGVKEVVCGGDCFTYNFSKDEDCVYFAHDMIYSEEMMRDFATANNISVEIFTQSVKGRNVPCFTVGEGENTVVVTSRHHACESTGTYVLQGFAQGCIENEIDGIKFLFVPFVDYDGVVDGDAGKGRLPYDHNRDYGEVSIYNETAKLRALADGGKVLMNFDFHSPHHSGHINDYPYIMKFSETKNIIYDEISAKLKELTESDADSMTYTGEQDLDYGGQWNEKTTPNIKNYFLDRNLLGASVTMETPYFGLEDNMFTQEKAIKMGKHLYEAAYIVLKEIKL